jgi:hypothetical protein
MNLTSNKALFDKDVDDWCSYVVLPRPRCAEWEEFIKPYLAKYSHHQGCWVAEIVISDWYRYIMSPEGIYEPLEIPDDIDWYQLRQERKGL